MGYHHRHRPKNIEITVPLSNNPIIILNLICRVRVDNWSRITCPMAAQVDMPTKHTVNDIALNTSK